MSLSKPDLTCTLDSHVPHVHEHTHSVSQAPLTRNASPKRRSRRWVIDSGATIHCVGDRSLLTSEYPNHPPVRIKVADNRTIMSEAVGASVISMTDKHGRAHEITLHNVVYSLEFGDHNLMSVRRLWKDNKISAHFKGTSYLKCAHSHARFPIASNGQYSTHTAHAVTIDSDIMHQRFGHASRRRVRRLAERSANFPKCRLDDVNHDPDDCDSCNAGGAKRKPFPKNVGNPYTYFGQRLSSDLCGPFPKSIQGYRYMLNIVDGCTNHLSTYMLRSKSSDEVKAALTDFLKVNNPYLQHGRPIRWHTDNGGEFTSADTDEFCKEFALNRSFSVPYAPPMNAHAERMWGIILRTMRIIIHASGVDESFWTYAASHATHLHNVLPSTRLAGEMSPYQAKYGMKPDVSNIRVWGCTCWYFLPEHERTSKIAPRAVPAVHLGLDPLRKGYIVYVPELNRITTAYHLTFQERKFLHFEPEGVINIPRKIKPLREVERSYDEERDHKKLPNQQADPEPNEVQNKCYHPKCTKPKHAHAEPHSFEDLPTRDQGRSHRLNPNHDQGSTRDHADLIMLIDDVSGQALAVRTEDILTDVHTPNSYREARNSRYASRWQDAMNKEIEDLTKHNTWDVINRNDVPKDRRITKSRWVYKVKLNRDGSIDRFKARFVVCGYSQVKGVDYHQSFSATMRATSLRILLSLAAGERLRLEHFDVTSAFTQADIDADVYIDPPAGYPQYEGKALKLRRSLYGTKQASRMWQLKLRSKLIEMGFSNSEHDPCLFCRRSKNGIMLIGVYVDDIVVAHNNEAELHWFTKTFTGPHGFNAKHLGPLNWFLGMGVDQSDDYKITINQKQFIDKLVERFIPTNEGSTIKHAMPCNPITFQDLSTAQNDAERDRASRLPYLQLIGSLLYLSTMTRPDIAYHMSILCSFMHDPSPNCYYAAIDLLLYIVHTSDITITFTGSTAVPSGIEASCRHDVSANGGLLAYSDATWRRPDRLGYNSFGYVVYLFGAPVSFASKRLKVIAHSSAEAEYAAASYAAREVVFVRNVLGDLGFSISGPTVLAVDNQAAIKIAENMGVTSRTKHFTDAVHYIRHLVDHRVVRLTFVRTDAQHADGFTKPLGKGPFRAWQRLLLRGSMQ